jgi:hypothetical protein
MRIVTTGAVLTALLAACASAPTPGTTPAPTAITAATALASGTPPAATPAPAPSGRIAFQRTGPDGGIFVIDADGSNERRILQGTFGTPRWSPDGTSLAVYQETEDHVGVAVVQADGSGLHALTLPSGLDCGLAVWAPDGRVLAVECFSEAHPDATGIYLVTVDGGAQPRRLTNGHGLPAEFSTDGAKLLFGRDYDGQHLDLAEVGTDGTNERTIGHLSIGQMPGYFGVGQFYVVADGAIKILNPTGTVARTIVAPELKIHEARLSPDGRFFAFIYDPLAAVSPGLYRIAVDGSGFAPIVHTNIEGIQEEHPDWAP